MQDYQETTGKTRVLVITGETDNYGDGLNLMFISEMHPHRGMQYMKLDSRHFACYSDRYMTIYDNEQGWKRAIKRAQKQFAEFN